MEKTINGIVYDVKIPKVKTTEEIKKRSDEKAMFAYGIAKMICDFAETNSEVEEIFTQAKCVFSWYQAKQKPGIFKNPITSDGFEMAVKTPQTETGGVTQ